MVLDFFTKLLAGSKLPMSKYVCLDFHDDFYRLCYSHQWEKGSQQLFLFFLPTAYCVLPTALTGPNAPTPLKYH